MKMLLAFAVLAAAVTLLPAKKVQGRAAPPDVASVSCMLHTLDSPAYPAVAAQPAVLYENSVANDQTRHAVTIDGVRLGRYVNRERRKRLTRVADAGLLHAAGASVLSLAYSTARS